MKIYEKPWKPMKTNENPWKPMKTHENPWKPMKIVKSIKLYENPSKK